MRFFLIVFFFFLGSHMLLAQSSPVEYYTFSSRIESKDTMGLYSKIFSPENKNPNEFYFLLAKGDYFLLQGNVKEALNNYSGAIDYLKSGARDSLYALANGKIGFLHYYFIEIKMI